jgi:uncharacterized membrane protein YbhN (UPF0104 family)
MSSRQWGWVRTLGGALVLGVLVWRLGAGPFVDGLRTIDARSLAAAAGIALVTTICCAWRWHLVARGLGVDVPLRTAVAAYYRSQFLNTTLPGGVLGDVERAVRHGRDVGDIGRGLRAVAWERSAGQVVQVTVSIVALLLLPSPFRSSMPLIATVLAVIALGAVVLGRILPDDGRSWWARTIRAAKTDIRDGLADPRAWPGIVLASVVVIAGHTGTFLIAARTAGSTESPATLLPLALLVLLAMAVPANIGGWGPREGVAAWAFAAAGLGADLGVATSVVYGVMVLVASLPGAVVMAATWLQRGRRLPRSPIARGVPQGAQWQPTVEWPAEVSE